LSSGLFWLKTAAGVFIVSAVLGGGWQYFFSGANAVPEQNDPWENSVVSADGNHSEWLAWVRQTDLFPSQLKAKDTDEVAQSGDQINPASILPDNSRLIAVVKRGGFLAAIVVSEQGEIRELFQGDRLSGGETVETIGDGDIVLDSLGEKKTISLYPRTEEESEAVVSDPAADRTKSDHVTDGQAVNNG